MANILIYCDEEEHEFDWLSTFNDEESAWLNFIEYFDDSKVENPVFDNDPDSGELRAHLTIDGYLYNCEFLYLDKSILINAKDFT